MKRIQRKRFSELIRELEYRRDVWKALAEGARIIFPQMAKAFREKQDKDILKLLEEENAKGLGADR